MKAIKLLHIGKDNKETKVATFYNFNEAAQCRDLLQAKCSDQDTCYYYIEYYNKSTKTISRQGADIFYRQVKFMHASVQHNIKLLLTYDFLA